MEDSTPPRKRLSETEIPALLTILFKIMDFNMICWNLYLVVSAVVLGWIFSSKEPFGTSQKLFISILYTLAIAVNSIALHMMDRNWLPHILQDLRIQASIVDQQTPGIREMLLTDPDRLLILPGKNLVWFVNGIAWPAMIICIWFLR